MLKKIQNQTGSAHIVISILLVLLILGVLGFVVWQNFIKQNTSVNTNVVNGLETSKEMDKPLGETITYRSDVIGVEFEYPKNWLKIECDDTYVSDPQNRVYFGTTNEGLAIVNGKDTQLCGGGSDFPPQMTIARVGRDGEFSQTYTEVAIDGKVAKKVTSTTGSDSTLPGLETTSYYVDMNNGQYVVFSYQRFPGVSDDGRDNTENSLRTFTTLIEENVTFL